MHCFANVDPNEMPIISVESTSLIWTIKGKTSLTSHMVLFDVFFIDSYVDSLEVISDSRCLYLWLLFVVDSYDCNFHSVWRWKNVCERRAKYLFSNHSFQTICVNWHIACAYQLYSTRCNITLLALYVCFDFVFRFGWQP